MKLTESETDSDTEQTPTETELNRNRTLSLTMTTYDSFKPNYHHRPPPGAVEVVVIYKECLKNHAAKLGGVALDGCGEFLPSTTSSLACAACGCHRNFHNRHQLPPTTNTTNSNILLLPPLNTWSSSPDASSPSNSPIPSPTPNQSYPALPHNFGYQYNQKVSSLSDPICKKRARTKFTSEQKVKMLAFAEKLGWKMAGIRTGVENERMVDEFCSEVGVKKGVFKVWMHNNKYRREKDHKGCNGNSDCNGNGVVNASVSDDESKVCNFTNNVDLNYTTINTNS